MALLSDLTFNNQSIEIPNYDNLKKIRVTTVIDVDVAVTVNRNIPMLLFPLTDTLKKLVPRKSALDLSITVWVAMAVYVY